MPLAPLARRRQQVFLPSVSPYLATYPSPFTDEDDNSDDLLSQSAYSTSIPNPLDLSYCDSSADDFLIDSRQSTPYDHSTFDSVETQLMTDGSSQNPRLYLQQSTPDGVPETYTPPPMSAGSYQSHAWNGNLPNWTHLNPNSQQHHRKIAFRSHKRLSSGSSTASAGPASPYTQTSDYPHIVDADTQSAHSPQLDHLEQLYTTAEQYAKPLIASSNPLNHGALFNPTFSFPHQQQPTSNAVQYAGAGSQAMSQGATGQVGGDMGGGNAFSDGASLQTEYDLSTDMRSGIPSLDQQVSDPYQDELFNPSMGGPSPTIPSASQTRCNQGNMLSPTYRSTFNERRQAADAARSASPASSVTRERSPFRDDSEFVNTTTASDFSQQGPNSPARINSAAQMRAQQKLELDAQAYAQHHSQISHQDLAPPSTVSPKETFRDFHDAEDETSNFALFPQPELHLAHTPNNSLSSMTPSVRRPNTSAGAGTAAAVAATAANTHVNDPYGVRSGLVDYSSQPPNPNDFSFMAPSAPSAPQAYPYLSHSRRQSSSLRSQNSDQIPEFPATLSSMESTKSEGGLPDTVRPQAFIPPSQPSSQDESSSSSPLQRPADTSANSGTYTCTAPSCSARFDTSARLQKHRRDVHRANSPFPSTSSNAATPSSSTSANTSAGASASQNKQSLQAAANNVSRNSLPGPHKCERTNPSTGKPCNTNFSRSYDLTRHEETIHANRKQKVRCQLCTETKTFSRNDALTRHMRVVHPDVEFSAKSGRRGRA